MKMYQRQKLKSDNSGNFTARRIAKMQPVLQADGEWVYPDIGKAREAVGLLPMEEYIRRRQNRMVQFIAGRPFQDITQAAPLETSRCLRWWRQPTVLPVPADDAVPSP